jgi:hypothetical protein
MARIPPTSGEQRSQELTLAQSDVTSPAVEPRSAPTAAPTERPAPKLLGTIAPAGLTLPPPADVRAVIDALWQRNEIDSGAGPTKWIDLDSLARDIVSLPSALRSAVVISALERVGWFDSDDLTRKLWRAGGEAWFRGLSLPAREKLAQAAREGVVSELDRKIHDWLIGGVVQDRLETQLAQLDDPAALAALRARYQTILGSERTVRVGDVEIPAPRAAGAQRLVHGIYRAFMEKPTPWGEMPYADPASIQKAVTQPRVVDERTQLPVHLPGLTLFRPGLAKVAPSPAFLYELAKHSDRLVLMYHYDDQSELARLRPMTEYEGVPLPKELEGKLFVVGRPERVLQPVRADTAVFLQQYDQIRRAADVQGWDRAHVNIFSHSQGAAEVALAQAVMAAHGLVDDVKHYTFTPASRGSLVADSNPALAAIVTALAVDTYGGESINELDPDYLAQLIPEFVRPDLVLWSDIGAASQPPIKHQLTRWSAGGADAGLAGGGSDGLIDGRVRTLVTPDRFMQTRQAYDHMGVIWDPDVLRSMLARLPPPDPMVLEALHKLAGRPLPE